MAGPSLVLEFDRSDTLVSVHRKISSPLCKTIDRSLRVPVTDVLIAVALPMSVAACAVPNIARDERACDRGDADARR